MIYKSQFRFYKLCDGNGKLFKVEDKGYKISVGKYKFFVNKWFTIIEEKTGKLIQKPDNFNPTTLQEVEDYLYYIYPFIDIIMKEKEIFSNLDIAENISEEDYYNLYVYPKLTSRERCL